MRMHRQRSFVFAVLAVSMVAACSSSQNSAAPSSTTTQVTASPTTPPQRTTPTPTPREFVSNRYGFRVTLTSLWSEQDASVPWDGKHLQGIQSPAFANFTDAATDRTLVAGAVQVAKETRLKQWRAAMVGAAPSVCSESSSTLQTTLGGEPALEWTSKCSDGYDVIKLATLHHDRGYIVFLPSIATNDDAANLRIFESIRRSFHFLR